MDKSQATVSILGGGPAGCAAALTLRRYLPALTVILIDRRESGTPNSPAIGEILSPGVWPLLGYLGLQEKFLQTGQLSSGGTASAWGTKRVWERDYLFTGLGTGWHLNRSDFDAWLIACAMAAGTEVIRARAKRVSRADGRWQIELDLSEIIAADVIVDATGRSAWFTRQQGILTQRHDSLVADVRWYVHDLSETNASRALVETVPDGWWYSATLPGQRGVAMFSTDSDLRRQSTWDDRLAAAPETYKRLEDWRPTGENAMRAANSQTSQATVGPGWVSAGDAAAAFDPISSLGIGFSLRSGMEAARVAAASEEPGSHFDINYSTSIDRIYADYRMRLRRIYRREGRWPQSSFWARRRTLAAA